MINEDKQQTRSHLTYRWVFDSPLVLVALDDTPNAQPNDDRGFLSGLLSLDELCDIHIRIRFPAMNALFAQVASDPQ